MFGFFGKKEHIPSITQRDKDWVEDNLAWLIEVFGMDLEQQPFILPTTDVFPYDDLKDPEQFQRFFEQMCAYWALNPNEIVVKFFDDVTSRQWTNWVSNGVQSNPIGLYYQSYSPDEKPFTIELALSNFDNVQLLISVMAHELAHVQLLGKKYIGDDHPDKEPLTDLATIYFGFGLLMANAGFRANMGAIFRSGYLPSELISYANALMCFVTQRSADEYAPFLNRNTNELFRKDFKWLVTTHETKLSPEKVALYVRRHEAARQADVGFAEKDFESVIAGYNKLLETDPGNAHAFHNLGYALLQQKKYREAIAYFTKAIAFDPYFAYAFNNRGYCNVQLGDLDNAYADLQTAMEMDPENSFSWRNLGAYHLALNEPEKALPCFLDAEKRNPQTDLINFYLGKTYLKLNNVEQATLYLDKSAALREHNDSVLD
jgi:tetratricopeptide (TPR) repeat protein